MKSIAKAGVQAAVAMFLGGFGWLLAPKEAQAAPADGAQATAADRAAAVPIGVRQVVPTVGVGFGMLSERMQLDLEGNPSSQTRSDLRLSIAFGLAHPVRALGPRSRLDGHGALAFGPTFQTGRYQLLVREDVTWAWDPLSWLTLRAGLGPGLSIDLTKSAMSNVELGLPLSITFARAVELVYRPCLAVGLGRHQRQVFGGTRAESMDTAVVPLDLTLRFRITALGF